MEEKPAEKITVTDIVNKADLNRSTFYAHFTCSEDVLACIQKDVTDNMIKFLDETFIDRVNRDPIPLLLRVAEFVEADEEFFTRLVRSKGADRFLESIQEVAFDRLVEDEMKLADTGMEYDDAVMRIRFITGGFVAVLKKWLLGETRKMPLKVLAKKLGGLIKNME